MPFANMPTDVSDEGRRASDHVNLHLSAIAVRDAVNKWVAIRLSDGGSDGTLYDTRKDAVRHQLDEFLCAYVSILPNGTTPVEMTRYLVLCRQLYDKGLRLSDPANDPANVIYRSV